MIRRILFTTTTAAALLAAAPAFAAEAAPSKQPCSCCSDGANHEVDHPRHEAQKQEAAAERKGQPRAGGENADLWNGSFGG
jgi:hypothetical protein